MLERAADALKLTAPDLQGLGVIDDIVPEPVGGAHRDHELAAARLREALTRHLRELSKLDAAQLTDDRYRRFRKLGAFEELALSSELRRNSAPPPDGAAGATARSTPRMGRANDQLRPRLRAAAHRRHSGRFARRCRGARSLGQPLDRLDARLSTRQALARAGR